VPVCFAEFVFDADSRVLLKRGQPVHLSPRGFRLLEILLRNRPRPVPKRQLMDDLWPGTVVSEGNLPNVVLELRHALQKDGGPELVRTVHRFGYAFSGDAQEREETPPEPVVYRVVVEGREIRLASGENWIGRGADCRVQVYSPRASRRHARILIEAGTATIEDGPSTHGTELNSQPITAPVRLRSGDVIRVGSSNLTFVIVKPDTPTDGLPPLPSAPDASDGPSERRS
jgi:DNA-binding winged helix-turn-helix (wHTH) protein